MGAKLLGVLLPVVAVGRGAIVGGAINAVAHRQPLAFAAIGAVPVSVHEGLRVRARVPPVLLYVHTLVPGSSCRPRRLRLRRTVTYMHTPMYAR